VKDIIVRDNKVELMGELSMYVIKSVAQKLMKKQQQEVKNLVKKHARELMALKA
jgi:hypothetical protein